ncbi:MAG: hypothetical protein WCI03_10200 [bacterium]
MKMIKKALVDIQSTQDLLEKAMKLSGLVTTVFKEAGWDLVVVGGSAVEFYTEGDYMSGDVDFCRRSLTPIPLRVAQEVMGQLDATGGPRSWMVAGLFVDLLGFVENEAVSPYREIDTPYGKISILPVELALVERVLTAVYPRPDVEARAIANLRRRYQMKSMLVFKVSWTWEEWQQSRALRKAISRQIGPPETRRQKSSSDRRLRAAFSGRRAP